MLIRPFFPTDIPPFRYWNRLSKLEENAVWNGDGRSVPDENELVVVIPPSLLGVLAGLEIGRRTARRAAPARTRHIESLFLELVERLLYGTVLQVEPRCVSIQNAVIGISRFIQMLAEHFPTQGDLKQIIFHRKLCSEMIQ